MEEILRTIVESLVENKDQVQISRIDDEKGRIIGKQGRIAKAIRTVMKSITAKENKKVGIIFEE